jgi:hypothetical protein
VVHDLTQTAVLSVSNVTTSSEILDSDFGQHLLSVEIQFQPKKEHLDVMFLETK